MGEVGRDRVAARRRRRRRRQLGRRPVAPRRRPVPLVRPAARPTEDTVDREAAGSLEVGGRFVVDRLGGGEWRQTSVGRRRR